jgi:hypothetical protein
VKLLPYHISTFIKRPNRVRKSFSTMLHKTCNTNKLVGIWKCEVSETLKVFETHRIHQFASVYHQFGLSLKLTEVS